MKNVLHQAAYAPKVAHFCFRDARRHPKPETLNPKPETLNPKPDTRNPKPETLNPKAEFAALSWVTEFSAREKISPLAFKYFSLLDFVES